MEIGRCVRHRSQEVTSRIPSLADAYYLAETVVLAPGIVSHEAAHLLACRVLGIETADVAMPDLFAPDVVISHERIESFPADLLVALAPLLCNTVLALAAFTLAPAAGTPMVAVPAYWLGCCFALTAFPSSGDTETLYETAGNVPRPLRPVSYLVAAPLRVFTVLPGSAGVAGFFWLVALFAVGRTVAA